MAVMVSAAPVQVADQEISAAGWNNPSVSDDDFSSLFGKALAQGTAGQPGQPVGLRDAGKPAAKSMAKDNEMGPECSSPPILSGSSFLLSLILPFNPVADIVPAAEAQPDETAPPGLEVQEAESPLGAAPGVAGGPISVANPQPCEAAPDGPATLMSRDGIGVEPAMSPSTPPQAIEPVADAAEEKAVPPGDEIGASAQLTAITELRAVPPPSEQAGAHAAAARATGTEAAAASPAAPQNRDAIVNLKGVTVFERFEVGMVPCPGVAEGAATKPIASRKEATDGIGPARVPGSTAGEQEPVAPATVTLFSSLSPIALPASVQAQGDGEVPAGVKSNKAATMAGDLQAADARIPEAESKEIPSGAQAVNHVAPPDIEGDPVANAPVEPGPGGRAGEVREQQPDGQLIQSARIVNRMGEAEMHMGVRTQAFGTVQVHTVVRDNVVGVAVGSEKGDLRTWLAAETPVLDHNFKNHDLRLASVQFLGSSVGTGAGFGGHPNRGQQGSYPVLGARTAAEPELAEPNPRPIMQAGIPDGSAAGFDIRA
jgi:hypothetical protein